MRAVALGGIGVEAASIAEQRPDETAPYVEALRLTSDGRTPNFRRNIVLKCDELLNPMR